MHVHTRAAAAAAAIATHADQLQQVLSSATEDEERARGHST
jgi:hypothetical protein